ncbi:MAG: XkdF-like putative serine protease domain-containing protein [Methanothrix sp.]|nr:XkdF-like putative serine protease domain-containing protein [Methanothrix sp.]MCX8207694.1 XkdF-like putative serine protease domain-containing protein [Methanothrix sp.]
MDENEIEHEKIAEKDYQDLDMAYAILEEESAGLDELREIAMEVDDPKLKEIIERIYEDEKTHTESLRQWIAEAGPKDEPASHDQDQKTAGDESHDEAEMDVDKDEATSTETSASEILNEIREVLEEHEEEHEVDKDDSGEQSEEDDDEDEDEDLEKDEDRTDVVAEKSYKSIRVPIIKGDQQIVYGIVSEPGVVDLQGDILTPEEIRKAAHNFMMKSQRIGVEHTRPAKASIIESYIAPVDFTCNGQRVRKGSWVMAVKIHDPELWAAVKRGEITGFSIAGTGTRTPV